VPPEASGSLKEMDQIRLIEIFHFQQAVNGMREILRRSRNFVAPCEISTHNQFFSVPQEESIAFSSEISSDVCTRAVKRSVPLS